MNEKFLLRSFGEGNWIVATRDISESMAVDFFFFFSVKRVALSNTRVPVAINHPVTRPAYHDELLTVKEVNQKVSTSTSRTKP